jgi:hypothetical protein
MPSDETRRILKVFGVAVTSLEDAIEAGKPLAEVVKWDTELAERTREVLGLVERLRSRRIG